MGSHLSAFVAEHLRPPTSEEAKELAALEQEDHRQRESERHERDVRRIFMAQPGATEADWSKQKADILAKDRAAQTVKQRDVAREQMTRSYRRSF
jgi:hypothetical protein